MIQSRYIIGLFTVAGSVLFSCSRKDIEVEKLLKVKDEALNAALGDLDTMDFESFYSKISMRYEDSSQKISFKTSMRIVKDSAISPTITYAAIPIVSALITPDSVKISNKREKCYIRHSLNYIKDNFGVDFSFGNLEELILGKPLDYDPERKYFRVKDPYAYIVCTHKKREVQKMEGKDEKEIIIFYELTEDLKELKSTRLESLEDTTTVKIDYLAREMIDGYNLPLKMNISVTTPRNEIFIELDYKKTRINQEEEVYFTIPETYETCK